MDRAASPARIWGGGAVSRGEEGQPPSLEPGGEESSYPKMFLFRRSQALEPLF